MAERIYRISEEIKREISNIIQNDLKDPRLPEFVSVLSVDTTRDLRYAKVYVSVYGNEEEKKKAMEGLKNAAGFIRREIGQRIKLRYTPELLFEKDDSIEKGIYMSSLINKVIEDEESRKPSDESEDE